MENYRIESDLLGELQVPVEAYYGVQTQRGINNYKVSNLKMSDFPEYIIAMGYIKLAAVEDLQSYRTGLPRDHRR